MKKKVLLMGASGSGKTSMRSVIFNNNPASLTSRLGATIDVEQNIVRFFGDLILNLWDCGGQDAFMESYLSTQRSTIFTHVGVLIYVFDVVNEVEKDVGYYKECLESLRKYSPDAAVFLLVHKMDLVPKNSRKATLEKKTRELTVLSGGEEIVVFGTSIYDESLYKAWSRIVHTLIPNAPVLARHLTLFAEACSATEVILFERTTFLVIATSDIPRHLRALANGADTSRAQPQLKTQGQAQSTDLTAPDESALLGLDPTRYERTSELVKAFKLACSRAREEFRGLELELPEYTAVLDELTKNTYVLVVVHDPTIETAAIKINIRLARQKFEELQADTIG